MNETTKAWWVEAVFGENAEADKKATIADEADFTLLLHNIAFAMYRSGQAKAADTLRKLILASDLARYQHLHPAQVRRALRLLRKPVYSEKLRPLVALVEIESKEEGDENATGLL